MIRNRGPQPPGRGPVPVRSLLGTGPHSRRWAAGEREKLHLPLPISPIAPIAPITAWAISHLPCGKTLFHETGPWCQKSWGPLIWKIFQEAEPSASWEIRGLKSCHQRGRQGKWCGQWKERLNIQTDLGWTLYDNRTLTHNLCSNQSWKPNHNLGSCSNQLKTAEPPYFFFSPAASLSISGPTRESQVCSLSQSQKMPPHRPLLVSPPPVSPVNILQSEEYLKPSPFSLSNFLTPLPNFESLPNTSDGDWLPWCSKFRINSLCSHLSSRPSFPHLISVTELHKIYWEKATVIKRLCSFTL